MMALSIALRSVGLLLAGAIFIPCGYAAAPVAPKEDKKEESPAQKLKKELEVAVTIEIPESPLPQAIAALKQSTKVNLVLDRGSIQLMGFDPNEIAVSLSVKQVKL